MYQQYDKAKAPSQERVEKFGYLSPMLDAAVVEMREFSKRKQDGIVSATKLKILNRLLSDIRDIVSGEETVNYFDPLDEEDLPQNSDAVLVLGQYSAALKSFKSAHNRYIWTEHVWVTKEWIEEHNRLEQEDYEEEEEEEEEKKKN